MIETLDADGLRSALDDVADVLHACVHAGASVNFVMPFAPEDARAFFARKVMPLLAAGLGTLFIARSDGRIVGTVILNIDTPPNQPHRADVSKLLVHPGTRRKGIARALMHALEAEAAACGRTLLTLDTRTGDTAEPLYRSLGYQVAGVIPGYCRDPFTDTLDSTTLMYKTLE